MTHTHEHEHEHGHEHGPGRDSGAERTDRETWDARYREKSSLWSGKPNPTLVSEAGELEPGPAGRGSTALDAAAGEGADVIWLARQGWNVTGLDVSGVALERAGAHAREAGDQVAEKITWLRADLLEWQPPQRAYGLVVAHFLHLEPAKRKLVYRKLADAVAPGGTLLVVAHHPSDLKTTVRRPPFPERFFTGDDLAADIGASDGWEVVRNVAAPREATDPDGNQVTIHDTLFRARRL